MQKADLLKAKLAQWDEWLNGHDSNSITQQIGHMLWRSAFYRALNESRKYVTEDGDGQKKANGPLHEMIDEGYFALHALAVRRLLEKKNVAGPLGVYSLVGLAEDIQGSLDLIDRASVLAARDLVYDYEPIKDQAVAEAQSNAKVNRIRPTFVCGEGWAKAEHWHGVMDELCGVSVRERKPTDSPNRARFAIFLKQLERHRKDLADWVNKHIAHAASLEGRKGLDPEYRLISLNKLWRNERMIVRAAGFLSYYFVCGSNVGGVPVPQFDQFEHITAPFTARSALQAMEESWDQHDRETRECQDWFWDRPLTRP